LQLRHTEAVECVAFTPDGKQIVSGSRLGDLRLWDVATGREVRSLPGHRLGTRAIAFSADGKTLISAGGDPAIRIHDLTTGRDRVLPEQEDEVFSIALSRDGKTLAVGDRSGKARLLDLTTGTCKRSIGDFRVNVSSLALSPDGLTLATAGTGSCGVRLWDTLTGKQRQVLVPFDSLVPTVAFAPDGKAILVAGSKVQLWDSRQGIVKRELFGIEDGLPCAAISPSGKVIAIAGISGKQEACLIDRSSGKEKLRIPGGEWGASCLAFSADSKLLALGMFEGVVRIVDAATGKDLHPGRGHAAPLSGIAFAPDGKTLATAGGHAVQLWDATLGTMRTSFEHPDIVGAMAFSPDGRVLAAGGGGERGPTCRKIQLWSPASGKLLHSISTSRERPEVRSLAFSPDSNLLAWADGTTHSSVHLWDVFAATEVQKEALAGTSAEVVGISPDNGTFVTGDRGNVLRLWELPKGKERPLSGKHGGMITGLAFAPHSQMFATSSKDGTVRVWEVLSGKELFRLTSTGGFGAVVFSKDGKFIFTGGTDGQIRLWHVFTATLVRTWEGHRAEVTGLSLSPDGRTLASCSRDTTALLWRIEESDLIGPPLRTLAGEELAGMWDSLASADATEAYRAISKLALAPEQAVPYLDMRMKSMLPTGARVRQAIADLDARRFQTRKKAQEQLEGWGKVVVPLLEETIRGKPTLEQRRRAEEVLHNLELTDTPPEVLRLRRSLRVLDMIGSIEARKVLEELVALGIPGAKSALDRMQPR
jgi:WD40 repeat protein